MQCCCWFLFLPLVSAASDFEDLSDAISSFEELTESFEDRRAKAAAWPQRWADLAQVSHQESVEVGAILVSEWADGANPDSLNSTLNALADGARQRLPAGWARNESCSAEWSLKLISETRSGMLAMNDELFEDLGLKGDTENYYDPANSFISAVLRRKLGIPISLSIIWAAVARRLDFDSYILARFPGHVLIRVPVGCLEHPSHDPTQDLYLDAFDASVMSWGDLQSFASRRGVSSNPEKLQRYVAPVKPADVHSRVLRNLWKVYGKNNDYAKMLGVIDMAVAFGVPEAEELKLHRNVVIKLLQQTSEVPDTF